MKQNQKPCMMTKKVINRGERSKTLTEVMSVQNISKNLQSFLEITPVQKEVLLSQKLEDHAYEDNKFVSHRARMSGEFDSRKDSYSAKFEQNHQRFV